jgi:hypothetical protein
MKVRDKVEELIYNLSIMNRVDIRNQEFRFTTIRQVIETYLNALCIDGYIQLPYQTINEISILYTIQNKIPKERYLYYTIDGITIELEQTLYEVYKQIVIPDYIYPLVQKYFKFYRC